MPKRYPHEALVVFQNENKTSNVLISRSIACNFKHTQTLRFDGLNIQITQINNTVKPLSS